MNCPHCGEDMDVPIIDLGPPGEPTAMYCSYCRLEGPRDVLEALAARLAPAGTLAAAEALLRAGGVHMISLSRIEGVTLWGAHDRKLRSRGTLADAVARLERERGHD